MLGLPSSVTKRSRYGSRRNTKTRRATWLPRGRWLLWDGARWEFDATLRAFDMARAVARVASADAQGKIAGSVASAKTVAAIVTLARADRRLAATVDQWDRDPWLLNTPAGVIDLRSGDCLAHDPERYISKITAVPPVARVRGGANFSTRSPGVTLIYNASFSELPGTA